MGEHVSWHFEPHSLFRSGIDGEDFPIGYISEGDIPRSPVFALHEVIGERSTESLAADALVAAAGRDLLVALEEMVRAADASQRPGGGSAVPAAARAAIAKARGL